MSYRLPTKLRRFGITDPFLTLIVAKYENEIPWETGIMDEAGLTAFVSDSMLAQLQRRIEFPPNPSVRNCFVSPRKIDAKSLLRSDAQLDAEDRSIIELILKENGETEASIELAKVVNQRKHDVFSEWIRLFEKKYANAPAFVSLLLRPLLDTSGKDTRRSIVPPSAGVVDWLYRRIQNRWVSPNENIASIYTWKLSNGAHTVASNGWQHIPRGVVNASRLVAASAGSGWCVADSRYARGYLAEGHFYLLRDGGRPVVALRTSGDGLCVIECQGRFNEPPLDWHEDIELFMQTNNLRWSEDQMNEAPTLPHGLLEGRCVQWWLTRCRVWPFAVSSAPKEVQEKLGKPTTEDMTPWADAPFFRTLLETAGIELGRAEWAGWLRIDPSRLAQVPDGYRETREILRACADGWIARIRDGEYTLDDNALISPLIADDPALKEALDSVLMMEVAKRVRQRPRTAMERLLPFYLDEVIPVLPNEPFDLAVERSVNALLLREDANFSDRIFDRFTRDRPDFSAVREAAWREAIQTQPPLWFALPEDLARTKGCVPHEDKPSRVDLDTWCEKVTAKPWLLTQKTGAPKSIRMHRRILVAYYDGWMEWLSLRPSRIWVRRGHYARVYMSYGLLANQRFPDSFADAWRPHCSKLYTRWKEASPRMQEMPVFQVSVLRMLGWLRAEQMTRTELNTCSAIANLQKPQRGQMGESCPYVCEIHARLRRAGFLVGRDGGTPER